MRRVLPTGLALGVVLAMSLPVMGQSPSPAPSLDPCALDTAVLFAPDVLGLTAEDATTKAGGGGFTLVFEEVESADADPGTIVAQLPVPGGIAVRAVPIVVSVAVAPVAPPRPTKAPEDLTTMPFQRLRAKAKEPKYRPFLRSAEAYLGDLVYFKGQVLQYVPGEDGAAASVLVQVTKDRFGLWDDIVWLVYAGKRVLPDDLVEFVGRAGTPYTYESAGSGLLTVPVVSVIQLRRVK